TATGSSRSRTTCSIAARNTPDALGARNGPISEYRPMYAPYPVAPSVRPRSRNARVEETRVAPWSTSPQKVSPLYFARRLAMRLMARSGSTAGRRSFAVEIVPSRDAAPRRRSPLAYLVRTPGSPQGRSPGSLHRPHGRLHRTAAGPEQSGAVQGSEHGLGD